MIPFLAFSATIQFECADVANIMESIERIKIVHMSEVQRKEVREALVSFATDKCPIM